MELIRRTLPNSLPNPSGDNGNRSNQGEPTAQAEVTSSETQPEAQEETTLLRRTAPVLVRRAPAFMSEPVVMTKYDYIRILTKHGLGRKEIAEVLGIHVKALDSMMKRDPELRAVIEEARRTADVAVVNALFRRATGYNVVELVVDRYGVEVKRFYKHIPPDVTACIFWLKNRMKDEWQDKYHAELTLRDRMELGYRAEGG